MVDYMFAEGSTPPCPDEGDIDGSGAYRYCGFGLYR
jgi:hypothetical protein